MIRIKGIRPGATVTWQGRRYKVLSVTDNSKNIKCLLETETAMRVAPSRDVKLVAIPMATGFVDSKGEDLEEIPQ